MTRTNGTSHEDISGQRVEWYSSESSTVDRSMVGSLESRYADVSRSAVQRLNAEDADMSQSAVMAAAIGRGTLRQSSAGVVVARSAACDQVRTGVLMAPVIRGEVHTWFDLRSAFAVGLGIVAGRAVLSMASALIQRRQR